MMADEEQTSKRRTRFSSIKKALLVAGLMIAAFLAAYIPGEVRIQTMAQHDARLLLILDLSEIQGQLGMACYEANRNNYANAEMHSSKYFGRMQALIEQTSDVDLKQKLQPFIAQRDEMTRELARANPSVKQDLARMYAGFYEVVEAAR